MLLRKKKEVNSGLTQKPREMLVYTPARENYERLPRAPGCTDRAQTSTKVSGRPSRVDLLSVFLKMLVQRDMLENRRTSDKHYVLKKHTESNKMGKEGYSFKTERKEREKTLSGK